MKKQLLIMLLSVFCFCSNAQTYCSITTASAYSMDMPGITNFTLNTINRTSLAIECGGVNCNNYVFATESADLVQGGTYNISITHTRDAVIFPNATNNIRIWIDYNNNGTLDDAGETVVSIDLQTYGTTTGSFTVPLSATLGNTRMRVTVKMSADAGHTLPSPCDLPADPLGYHGEFEDYSVNISGTPGTTGTEEKSIKNTVSVFPNPSNGVFKIQSEIKISMIEIMNVLGAKVYSTAINAVEKEIDLTREPKGIYFYTLTDGGNIITRGRLIVD